MSATLSGFGELYSKHMFIFEPMEVDVLGGRLHTLSQPCCCKYCALEP